MKIITGLFENAVFQRNSKNVSAQPVTGRADFPGKVHCTAEMNGIPVLTIVTETDPEGAFSFQINGLPVGGPFRFICTVGNDSLTVENVLVGDVWILAGQSNMQGVGALSDDEPDCPMVRNYYLDERWDVACGKLHNMHQALDEVHWKILGGHGKPAFRPSYKTTGIGPGKSFGKRLFEKTGIPQGLIACAHGGTTLEQWDPALKDQGPDGSLYAAMVRRIRLTGGRVAGLFWYQGCSNTHPDNWKDFGTKTYRLFETLRQDLNEPHLPIVTVQIARNENGPVPPENDARWSFIREEQRNMQSSEKRILTVPAIDLTLGEWIHLDTPSYIRLGRRAAEAMQTLRGEEHALPPPIELESIQVGTDSGYCMSNATLTFRNVVGALTSGGAAPCGFTLLADGKPLGRVANTRLDGNRVILRLVVWGDESALKTFQLAYCYGMAPYGNITDQADRAIPAFGPLNLVK